MSATARTNYGGIKLPPNADAIALAVGKFIINCGLIEHKTYLWIRCLAPANLIPTTMAELGFAKRIQWIKGAMDQRLGDVQLKSDAAKMWDEVSTIFALRNIIAHSPLLWHEGPNGTTVAIWKSIQKAISGRPSDVLDLNQICNLINRTQSLAAQLEAQFEKVAADIGIQIPPEPSA